MSRAVSRSIWRCYWPTAVRPSLIWRCCASSPPCSGRWPRIRPRGGSSTASTPRPWPGCGPPGRPRGSWPGSSCSRTRRSLPVTTVLGRALPGFVLDIDATIVLAHSEKEAAAPTWKHTFGFHPLLCFLDATGEALAGLLRSGNAGSNTATDHVTVLDQALQQIPEQHRYGSPILVRSDPTRRAAATSSSLTSAACASVAWTRSSRSGSRSPHLSGPRSPPPRVGWRRSTVMAACATARNWPSSPTTATRACWPRSRPAPD